MRYPRRCQLCRTDYTTAGRPEDWQVTLRAESRPLSRRPQQQGYCLLLRCLVCVGEYWWDTVGDVGRARASAPEQEGAPVGQRRRM